MFLKTSRLHKLNTDSQFLKCMTLALYHHGYIKIPAVKVWLGCLPAGRRLRSCTRADRRAPLGPGGGRGRSRGPAIQSQKADGCLSTTSSKKIDDLYVVWEQEAHSVGAVKHSHSKSGLKQLYIAPSGHPMLDTMLDTVPNALPDVATQSLIRGNLLKPTAGSVHIGHPSTCSCLTFGPHHEVPRVGVRVHVAMYQGHLRKQLHKGQAHRPRVDPLTLELRLVCELDALTCIGI